MDLWYLWLLATTASAVLNTLSLLTQVDWQDAGGILYKIQWIPTGKILGFGQYEFF